MRTKTQKTVSDQWIVVPDEQPPTDREAFLAVLLAAFANIEIEATGWLPVIEA